MMKLFPFSLSLNNNLLTLLLCFSHRHSLSTNAMAQYGGRQLILRVLGNKSSQFSLYSSLWQSNQRVMSVRPSVRHKLISSSQSSSFCLRSPSFVGQSESKILRLAFDLNPKIFKNIEIRSQQYIESRILE